MAHTPGPWRVEQVEGSFQVPFHVLSGQKLVAVCTGDQLNPEWLSVYQSRINANLIAAAPELLYHLKAAAAVFRRAADQYGLDEFYQRRLIEYASQFEHQIKLAEEGRP